MMSLLIKKTTKWNNDWSITFIYLCDVIQQTHVQRKLTDVGEEEEEWK